MAGSEPGGQTDPCDDGADGTADADGGHGDAGDADQLEQDADDIQDTDQQSRGRSMSFDDGENKAKDTYEDGDGDGKPDAQTEDGPEAVEEEIKEERTTQEEATPNGDDDGDGNCEEGEAGENGAEDDNNGGENNDPDDDGNEKDGQEQDQDEDQQDDEKENEKDGADTAEDDNQDDDDNDDNDGEEEEEEDNNKGKKKKRPPEEEDEEEEDKDEEEEDKKKKRKKKKKKKKKKKRKKLDDNGEEVRAEAESVVQGRSQLSQTDKPLRTPQTPESLEVPRTPEYDTRSLGNVSWASVTSLQSGGSYLSSDSLLSGGTSMSWESASSTDDYMFGYSSSSDSSDDSNSTSGSSSSASDTDTDSESGSSPKRGSESPQSPLCVRGLNISPITTLSSDGHQDGTALCDRQLPVRPNPDELGEPPFILKLPTVKRRDPGKRNSGNNLEDENDELVLEREKNSDIFTVSTCPVGKPPPNTSPRATKDESFQREPAGACGQLKGVCPNSECSSGHGDHIHVSGSEELRCSTETSTPDSSKLTEQPKVCDTPSSKDILVETPPRYDRKTYQFN